MTWNITVTDTMAESYLPATSATAGTAAEDAADRNQSKYQAMTHIHTFIPLAFETFGPINSKGTERNTFSCASLVQAKMRHQSWVKKSVSFEFNAYC